MAVAWRQWVVGSGHCIVHAKEDRHTVRMTNEPWCSPICLAFKWCYITDDMFNFCARIRICSSQRCILTISLSLYSCEHSRGKGVALYNSNICNVKFVPTFSPKQLGPWSMSCTSPESEPALLQKSSSQLHCNPVLDDSLLRRTSHVTWRQFYCSSCCTCLFCC